MWDLCNAVIVPQLLPSLSLVLPTSTVSVRDWLLSLSLSLDLPSAFPFSSSRSFYLSMVFLSAFAEFFRIQIISGNKRSQTKFIWTKCYCIQFLSHSQTKKNSLELSNLMPSFENEWEIFNNCNIRRGIWVGNILSVQIHKLASRIMQLYGHSFAFTVPAVE